MGRKFHCHVHKATHTILAHVLKQNNPTQNSISSRSFPIRPLRRCNFLIYVILIVNLDSMSGSRFNLDILYVVPILVSLIVLNYSLYLEYLRHVLSYNVYCHFNWAYQLRCTSWCVWNGLMYGRLTKFLNGRSPFLVGTSFRLVMVLALCIISDRGKKTRFLH
jgi:hypothetical protein